MNRQKMKGLRAILHDLVKIRRMGGIVINAQGGKLIYPVLSTIWRTNDAWLAYLRSEKVFKETLAKFAGNVPEVKEVCLRTSRQQKLLPAGLMKKDGTIDMHAIAAKALARNEALAAAGLPKRTHDE